MKKIAVLALLLGMVGCGRHELSNSAGYYLKRTDKNTCTTRIEAFIPRFTASIKCLTIARLLNERRSTFDEKNNLEHWWCEDAP